MKAGRRVITLRVCVQYIGRYKFWDGRGPVHESDVCLLLRMV